MIQMKSIVLLLLFILTHSQIDVFQVLSTPAEGGDLAFLRALNNFFGCKTWVNGGCVQCSQSYIFNDNKICSEVTPQCKKFNRAVGICQGCYLGYQIYNGQCILVKLAESINKGCKSFEDGKCVECSARWYFDKNHVCQPVDDNCRKWEKNGLCTSCYMGYKLNDGKCTLGVNPTANIDKFCSVWQGLVCKKCAERAYFGPIGYCIPVSDFCQTWDNYDGFCLTCYKGYTLKEGKCVVKENKLPPNLGCRKWNWDEEKCLQCSKRWVFTSDGNCVPVSDDCKRYDENGNCLECYKGYDLDDGQCVLSKDNEKQPSDLGCKKWNWDEDKCLQCSFRWVFDESKKCRQVSNFCKSYDQNGKCTSCFPGYSLKQGECLLQSSDIEPQDPGCKIWDWQQQKCIQCSKRWYLGKNDKCQKVNDQCKNYDEKGSCTDCYPGYHLNNGDCSIQEVVDHCIKKEFNECTECYEGYRVFMGKCIPSNPLCKKVNSEGNCQQCFSTYVLHNKTCIPMAKLASLAEYYKECCPQKFQKLKGEGRIL